MIKKILIILIGIIFLTGCSNEIIYDTNSIDTINYNLNINDMYTENIISILPSNAYEIAYNSEDDDVKPLEYNLLLKNSYPLLANFDIQYNKNILERDNDYKVILDYEYVEDDYIKSTFLNTCFENKNIIQEENYLEINLSGRINCYMDNTINIYVTTDYDILESNGKKENNTYYWTIDDSNNTNVDINYKISRVKKNMKKYYNSKNSKKLSSNLLTILGATIILITLIIIYKNISKKYMGM